MPQSVRAVLFDLGDTLIHYGQVDKAALFNEAVWRTYQLWARRQQRMPDYRRYYLHQWFALRWGYIKLLIRRREMDAMRLIRRTCRKLWLNAPEEFFNELAWNWYRPLAEVSRVEPGTLDTLRWMRDRGLQLGIVSNTFVPGFVLDRHLKQQGLLRFFPTRVYSCDVGYRKPDRRIFDIALQRMGVEANQAAFVGDTPAADIGGATRAGFISVWKRNGQAAALDGVGHPHGPGAAQDHCNDYRPRFILDRIADLPAMLAPLIPVSLQPSPDVVPTGSSRITLSSAAAGRSTVVSTRWPSPSTALIR